MNWKNHYPDNYCHFITSSIKHYVPIFRKPEAITILINNINFYREKYKVKLIAYVIMPDHIHLLIHSPTGDGIRKFMQNLLRDSSRKFIEVFSREISLRPYLNRFQYKTENQYRIWKEQLRCLPMSTEKMFKIRFNYIHKNPLRKGLVKSPEEYYYSSYINYYTDKKPLLEVDKDLSLF